MTVQLVAKNGKQTRSPKRLPKKGGGEQTRLLEDHQRALASVGGMCAELTDIPMCSMLCPEALVAIYNVIEALIALPDTDTDSPGYKIIFEIMGALGIQGKVSHSPTDTAKAIAVKVWKNTNCMLEWYKAEFNKDTMIGFGPSPSTNTGVGFNIVALDRASVGLPIISIKNVRAELQLLRQWLSIDLDTCGSSMQAFNHARNIVQEKTRSR